MIEVPRGVLVGERVAPGCWSIYSDQATEHHVETSDADDDRDCAAFANRLADTHGGVGVRCVVLVADGGDSHEPRTVAAYPRHVHVITRHVALANASSRIERRMIVVSGAEIPSASLVARTRSGWSEHPILAPCPARVLEIAAAFGVDRFALQLANVPPSHAQGLLDTLSHHGAVEVLGHHAHIAGAARYGAVLAERDGVWEDATGGSRLNARRSLSYTIHRTTGPVFDESEPALTQVVDDRPLLFAVDRRVHAIHGEAIRDYARRHPNVRGTVLISPLESDKGWRQVERICQTAIDVELPRRGLIVAIGGGVTLDVAGLAAALYRRGVGYVRVATTLVGQVDVSVGLKQAVNACGRKNLIGAFYAPVACINDYNFLRTLPPFEVACGLAEVVKIALVRDARLFDDVERHGSLLVNQPGRCASAVARDIWYRAECLMLEELSSNLFETSLERLVDFGHTFSPTIETGSNYRIAHGQAVALDMLLSTSIAVQHGLCDCALFHRLAALLRALSLDVWSPHFLPIELLRGGLASSRLHRGGTLNLVVPVGEGRATLVQSVADDELARGVAAMRSLGHDWQVAPADSGVA